MSDIIVKTDTETASKVIEEINDIETDTNLSLEVISGISEKDENKLNQFINDAVNQAYDIVSQAVRDSKVGLHGRDYYVQDDDPMKDAFNDDNAFSRAMDERRKHLNALGDFEDYIRDHIEHISNQ